MKKFEDMFPKTDFAMDALVATAVGEAAGLSQEEKKALFMTIIGGIAMLAGTAVNGRFGHGDYSMEDALTAYGLLKDTEERFIPTAIRVADMEDKS